jgi:hypothetical protein
MSSVSDIILELVTFALALTLTAGACSRQSFTTEPNCDPAPQAEARQAK